MFLREVLQNAMDASKLQLWSDLCSDAYLAWMGPMDETRRQALQPYDIKGEIYRNYPIRIELSAIDTDRVKIQITDRGTGISVEPFKRMCNVGESNAGSDQLRAILRRMPSWLRPTARFGIGLQSIFLVADQFTIDTSTGQDTYHALFTPAERRIFAADPVCAPHAPWDDHHHRDGQAQSSHIQEETGGLFFRFCAVL